MTRLGLWGKGTAFSDFKVSLLRSNSSQAKSHSQDFQSRIDNAGVAAMEMVAMEMKALGMYCSRHLSFEGCTFDVHKHSLSKTEKANYDAACR